MSRLEALHTTGKDPLEEYESGLEAEAIVEADIAWEKALGVYVEREEKEQILGTEEEIPSYSPTRTRVYYPD